MNILLIEDNEADLKIVLRAFDRLSYKNNIFTVKDGQEALDFIYHEGLYTNKGKYYRPDIILLDLNIPKLTGFDVLKRLKKDPQYNFIPVVMLTSSTHEMDVVKSYSLGASGYIQKPAHYEEYVKMVEGFNFYWYVISKLPRVAQP